MRGLDFKYFLYLLVFINSCCPKPTYQNVKTTIIGEVYSIEFNFNNKVVILDSTYCLDGNPRAIGFKDQETGIGIQLFIGTEPIPSWYKFVEDLNQNQDIIFQNYKSDPHKNLIKYECYKICGNEFKSIQYSYMTKLEKIESMFQISNFIVNIELFKSNSSNLDSSEFWAINKKFITSIKIIKV